MTALNPPNYTQVPNALFEQMPEMGDAELRCTLALVRKIIGFHKDKPEPVSYSQLMIATGLSRQGVRNGLKAALARGTVIVEESGTRKTSRYTLNFADQPNNELVNEVDQSTRLTRTSQRSRPELVNEVDTQKKDSKEKRKELTEPVGTDSDEQPKPKRKRSAKQLALDAMKNSLADAFGLDHDKVTGTKWDEFGKAGKELLEVGATPADIPLLHTWCLKQNWPTFTSMAMAKNWPNFDKERQSSTQAQHKSHTDSQSTRAALYGGES